MKKSESTLPLEVIKIKEQQGEKRAKYGEKILQGLSDYLTAHLGKGYSVDNLKLMRRFFVVYSEHIIEESPVSQSVVRIGESLITQFPRISASI